MDAIGDTFLPSAEGSHLWVIVSDPKQDPDEVLVVSLTTWHVRKEQTCILEAREHPWATHRTCVSYRHNMVVTLKQLYAGKDTGALKVQAPMPRNVLERILEGATRTDSLKPAALNILKRQGLIP